MTHIPQPFTEGFVARMMKRMRGDLTAGILLAIAALLGFVAMNTPLAEIYSSVRDFRVGPAVLGLDLTIAQWASDGLLAIFFFLVGLELKREFVAGDLRNPRTAFVPVAAALGGVLVPALIYLGINWGTEAARGWAIPTATDIAFAVAVLGLIAPRIPVVLRIFLLTLAVVDDLIAIGIIAMFFTDELHWQFLLLALIPIGVYAWMVQRYGRWFQTSAVGPWFLLLPIGVVAWALVHESGIHATVTGVILAFTVPVKGARGARTSEVFEERFTPLSTGIAVPVFAFFAAGVAISGEHHFPADPIALGIMIGLVVGKPIGIVGTTLLIQAISKQRLSGNPALRDLVGVGCLAGVGFTVSLLVTELSFSDAIDTNTGRLAVLVASIVAIVVAAVLLARKRPRDRTRVLATVGQD